MEDSADSTVTKETIPLTSDVDLEEKEPSTPSQNNNNTPNISKNNSSKLIKSFLGASIGHFFEWYDFQIFALLAHELGDSFFPDSMNNNAKLIVVFSLFGGSFFMRPLGGILFGYIGDKFNRLISLRISIFLMAIPTFLIGLLPKYKQIGIVSTVLLVIFRLLQGISCGGEITTALTYVLEICPENKKSLFGALVNVTKLGMVLASIIIAVLKYVLSDKQMSQFGWRIPFLLGITVAYFGIWIRKSLHKSQNLIDDKSKKIVKNPTLTVLRDSKLEMLICVFHASMYHLMFYTFFAWIPNYLQNDKLRNGKHIISNPYVINVISLVFFKVLATIGGYFGDKYKPKYLMIIFGLITLISIVILFPLLASSNIYKSGVILCVIATIFGLYYGSCNAYSVSIFANNIQTRNSGLGISYNIAAAIFGGTAPLVGTALVKEYNLFSFGLYLVIVCSNSLFFMFFKDYLVNIRNKCYQKRKFVKIIENNQKLGDENVKTIEMG